MKFSHQLKFNSVADWKDHYVHYANLKKIIYDIARLEQAQREHAFHGDGEHGLSEPLLRGSGRIAGDVKVLSAQEKEDELWKAMDEELKGIIAFYMRKEAEVLSKLEALDLEVHKYEKEIQQNRQNSLTLDSVLEDGTLPIAVASSTALPDTLKGGSGLPDALTTRGSAPVAGGILTPPDQEPTLLMRAMSSAPRGQRVRFWSDVALRRGGQELRTARDKMRLRFNDIFTTLNDLIEYLDLNREGFRKLIKKHDKLCSSNLKDTYWPMFEQRYPLKRKEELQRNLDRVVDLFSIVFTGGDVQRARELLSRNLREHIKVERNTVWRDMVAMERRTVAATVETTPGAKKQPWYSRYRDAVSLLLAIGVFVAVLNVEIFVEPEKNNCLAVLALASTLWATEAIPLFATAMLIPLLIVVLRVLVDRSDPQHPTRLTPEQAAQTIFHSMFSQVTMLLLGGFSIAAALSKHFIAKQMAIAVLSRVGRKPRNVLLASMFVATFMSMWISNVAAPVLCFSLVQPILRTMDVTTPFAKAIVMGIALASNIGGMTSPISSPQNIIAIDRMSSVDGHPPSWLAWFAVALPVAIIGNFICWALLLLVYQPWTKTTEIRPLKPNTDPVTWTQVYVIVVSCVTVGLWCANSVLQKVVGEMGVVAVFPMIAFFGFGVLNKDDFNGFLWNVVMLAMGGSALGEAVKSSGLLETIAISISGLVDGIDLWAVTVIFCGCVLVCTTFISHTVGAMVILPIVQQVGSQMPGHPHPKLLIMAAALMCSGAMGLPVSGFPNMNAVSLEDSTGQTFVSTFDFVKTGVPGSILVYGVIVTVGYSLMMLLGF